MEKSPTSRASSACSTSTIRYLENYEKRGQKFWIGSVFVPVIISIFGILAVFIVTEYQIEKSQEQFIQQLKEQEKAGLLNRIQSTEDMIGTCKGNLSETDINETKEKLNLAKYYWTYKNYTKSEELLDDTRNTLHNCLRSAAVSTAKTSLFTILLVLTVLVVGVYSYYLRGPYSKNTKGVSVLKKRKGA